MTPGRPRVHPLLKVGDRVGLRVIIRIHGDGPKRQIIARCDCGVVGKVGENSFRNTIGCKVCACRLASGRRSK